jgi:acid phosphatase
MHFTRVLFTFSQGIRYKRRMRSFRTTLGGLALAGATFIATACATGENSVCSTTAAGIAGEAGGVPAAKRVFMVIFETTDAHRALSQPFFRELAARGASLADSHGLTHPSQPNYIGLIAGSQMGIDDNEMHTVEGRHLGHLLEEKGKSWKVYADGYPGGCYLGKDAGAYARRHVPFLSFADIQDDPERCARVAPATELAADVAQGKLPDFGLYIPDNNNNGHDTSIEYADRWLRATFEPLLRDPAFLQGTLFIVTFDEADESPSNQITTVLLGDMVRPGSQSNACQDHYSMLRTVEEALGLGSLERMDAQSGTIQGVWAPPSS